MVSFSKLVSFGVGFTVIINDVGKPIQKDVDGVTVIVPEMGKAVVLDVVKEIFPVPLAAKPIDGLLLVQLNVVPAIEPVNTIKPLGTPSLYVVSLTEFAVGVGCTTTVVVAIGETQPPTIDVYVTA